VLEAKAAFQIGDIMEEVQHERRGFGLLLNGSWQAQLKGGSWYESMRCIKAISKAGGEDEVYKGHFPGQVGRVDEMGECGTTEDELARPLVNGKE